MTALAQCKFTSLWRAWLWILEDGCACFPNACHVVLVQVGHVQHVSLTPDRTHKMKTISLKPLLFGTCTSIFGCDMLFIINLCFVRIWKKWLWIKPCKHSERSCMENSQILYVDFLLNIQIRIKNTLFIPRGNCFVIVAPSKRRRKRIKQNILESK